MHYLFPFYLFTINAVGFVIMLLDKHYAKINHWRIRESTLLTVAAIGGSLGSLLGMQVARHKTQKLKFKFFVPLFLLLHCFLILWFASLMP